MIPLQADEREQIEAQAQLLAFDRQNHSGASDALAANLKARCRRDNKHSVLHADHGDCRFSPAYRLWEQVGAVCYEHSIRASWW